MPDAPIASLGRDEDGRCGVPTPAPVNSRYAISIAQVPKARSIACATRAVYAEGAALAGRLW